LGAIKLTGSILYTKGKNPTHFMFVEKNVKLIKTTVLGRNSEVPSSLHFS
jgi:hypothetical protein